MRTIYKSFEQLLLAVALIFSTQSMSYAQCTGNTTSGSFCTRSNFYYGEILPNSGCGTWTEVTPYSPGEYFRAPVLPGACYSISTCGAGIDTQIGCFQGTLTTGPFAYNDDNGPLCTGTAASVDFTPTFNDYVRVDVRQYNCQGGGSASITLRLRQNNNLSITSSNTDFCQGQSRTLTATPAAVTPFTAAAGNGGTFTGTGVSGTIFTAPAPPGSSDIYTITYTYGYCSTTQDLRVYSLPTTANAGPDQMVNVSTATMAANTPTAGFGTWTLIGGSGTITSSNNPNSGITGLGIGVNTFRWTVANGPCTVSTDDVDITFSDPLPELDVRNNADDADISDGSVTISTALGTDFGSVCAMSGSSSSTFRAENNGGGVLTFGADALSISNTTDFSITSDLTNNGTVAVGGVETFTIQFDPASSGLKTCTVTISSDDADEDPYTFEISGTGDADPTTANAGPDQNVCATTATLAGNTPTVGTGSWSLVSGLGTVTTPSSPTSGVTGLGLGANVFRWTIDAGNSCPNSTDDVTITMDTPPTPANAGPDQNVCATTATLAGNTPIVGTGSWSLVSGSGTVTTPSSPTSGVTGLGAGANVFRWTIDAGNSCPNSTDDVTITRDTPPTVASAGPDQNVCATTATLAGNTPTVGTGSWSLVSGSGTVTTPGSPTSGITGLGLGANVFRWTIDAGNSCPNSTDDVTITRDTPPTVANAGPDQNVCATTATLAGNTPAVGTGSWSLVSGSGTVTTPGSLTSGITGLGLGANVFRWTVDAGNTCPNSTDDVTITRDTPPTVANAGPDQNVCATTATLAGNTPTIGTGSWSLVSGSGTVTTPGSPTSGVTGLGAGANVFRWTIDAGNSCPNSTDDVTITRDTPPTPANAGPDQNVCATTATLAGNTPTVGTGSWSLVSGSGTVTTPGSPTSGITGLGSGANVFRWTVDAGNTCPNSTDDVTITRDTPPTVANAGPDQNVCATTATLAGNTPTVGTGSWSLVSGSGTVTMPSSSTSGVTGLGVGANVFRWTVEAGNSCPNSTDDVTITRGTPPTVANAGPDQNVCGTSTALAANAPSVGTGMWSVVAGIGGSFGDANSPTSSFSGTAGQTYTLRWTISNAPCPVSTDDVDIAFIENPTAAAAGADEDVCGTSTMLAANTPTIGTGMWSVVAGIGGSFGDANSPTSNFSGTAGQTYTLRWTISNAPCPVSTDDVVITFVQDPTPANAGPDQNLCGTSTMLAANTPTIGTGSWTEVSGDGNGMFGDANSPTSSFSGTAGQTYTLRWTISNVPCPVSTDDVNIEFIENPVAAAAGADQEVCGTSTSLSANAPGIGSGAWTEVSGDGNGMFSDASSPTSSFSGTAGQTYTLRWTVTNAPCPVSTDDVMIAFVQNPTPANAGSDQTGVNGICGTSVNLAANMPTIGSGAWTEVSGDGNGMFGDTNSPNSSFDGTAGQTYTLRWTVSNAPCPVSMDEVDIEFIESPTAAAAGADQDVCSTSTSLSANAPIIGSGAWTEVAGDGNGIFGDANSPTSTFSGTAGQTYTLRWTVTNAPCPVSTDDVVISFVQDPTPANAGPNQNVCGTSTMLAANAPTTGTGTWTEVSGDGNGMFGDANSPTSSFSGTVGQTYTLRWTVSNAPCPVSTDDIDIEFIDNPAAAAAGADQDVCGTSTSLSANTPTIGTGAWTVVAGDGNGVFGDANSPTSSFSGTAGQTYTLRWTVSNAPCPISTDDVVISFIQDPTSANAGPDQTGLNGICGTSVDLAANTPTVGSGMWSIVSGTGGMFSSAGSPTSTFSGTVGTTYTLRWTVSNAPCPVSIDDVDIEFIENPSAAAAGADQDVCGTSTSLSANTPGVGTGAWTVVAGDGNGMFGDASSPSSSFSGTAGQSYTLRWTVSNAPCPVSTDDVVISFIQDPTPANAGADQDICGTSTMLAANTPAVGTGSWSELVGDGNGMFGNLTSPMSTFSGTAGVAYTLRWATTNAPCAASIDDVVITFVENPTTANAGPDQDVCGTSTNLAANTPSIGAGAWSILSGAGGMFTNSNSPTSMFSGNAGTAYVLRWTISNDPCTASIDDVNITFVEDPTAANAGSDQTLCGTSTDLAANTPTVGSGTWSEVAGDGNGVFASATDPASMFSGTAGQSYTLRWTVSNAPCPVSTDDVDITFVGNPTPANAGADQNVCGTSTFLGGNTPMVGMGAWSIISGAGGAIISPSDPTSMFTGTPGNTYVLRWQISNVPCSASFDDVTVQFFDNPTAAAAGPDQTMVCNGDGATMAANGPAVGSGFWSEVTSFGVSFGDASSPNTTVSNLPANNTVTLRWTISNGPCPVSTDDVDITTITCCILEVTCPAITSLGAYDCTTLGNIPAMPTNQTEAEASPYNIVFGNMPCGTIMVSASDDMGPNTCSGATQTVTRTVFIWDDLGGGMPGVFEPGTEESVSCTFTYTLQPDNTPPDIVCPSDQTIEWAVGFNTAPVGANTPQDPSIDPAVTGVPMASDDCGIGQLPINCSSIAGPVTPLNFDGLGLISTGFVVNGVAPIPPTLTCVHEVCVTVHMIADIAGIGFEQSNIRDEGGNVIGQNDNSVGDCNSAGAYSTMCIPVAAYNAYAADGTLDFSIDTDGDIDNTCAVSTIQASVEICSACGPGLTYQDVITGPSPANCPDLWVVERTWTVVDQCGTPASCVQTFTFTDTTPPIVNTCSPDPAPIEWPVGFNTNPVGPNTPQDPSIDPSNYPNIVYSDNCAVVSVGYQDVITGPTPGNCPNLWIVERTWTVTDACGLTGNCVQTFTFTDTTPPTLANCPADPAPIEWPAGFNTASVGSNAPQDPSIAPAVFGMPTASDNCGTPTLSYQDVIIGPSPANCPDLWVVERTWTATDACGLTATCTQTFTFTDTTPPSIGTCPPTLNVDGCGTADILNGGLTALPYSATPVTITEAEFVAEGGAATDNCAIVSYEYVDVANGTCPTVVTRVFTVTDACGLTHTCTQLINIDDNTPPVVTCMDITVSLGPNGDLTITPAQVHDPAGDSDNCGTVNIVSVSPNSFTCQNEGSNTVTLTAEDACGNQGICTATVFVEDFITNLSAIATAETCAGAGDGTITASGTSGGGQLRYSLDGVNFQPAGLFANLSPGTYTVTFKVFGIPAVCVKTMAVTVAAGPPLVTWYKDNDNDNWSDGTSEVDCVRPAGYKTSAELGGNTSGDCNDNNPAINPGAAEICDGLDNDCDGIVPADELDVDGDGYRVCDNDCDDNNPAINPGAAEICNGIDDNCNGMVDEGISGLTYTGNVYFSTQAQVDAWPPCYSIIDGSVTIVGVGINNLGPLSNIVDITGSLTIQSTGLTTMSGLDGLAHVGGTVTLYFNSSLTTLNGLEALNAVGGSLYMYYNFQLNDCCAVSDLVSGGVTGPMLVFFNKAGCNSVLEIITTCPASPLVGNGGQLSGQPGHQLKEVEKATVYPNPTSGAFTVVLPKYFDRGKLIVTDITGRTMMRQDITEGQSIYQFERKGLTAGIYMVVIKPAGQPRQSIRLIVE